ncbi:MAG: toxic anion resistance protein [Firmicutes bacterium]|nr:toxic anion resistance protein [Bacillota bacterium]
MTNQTTLTIAPNLNEPPKIIETQLEESSAIAKKLAQLTETEQADVANFANQIDISDTNLVIQYGAAAQKHIADFSSQTLNNIRTKDIGDVGNMLANLTLELRGFNFEETPKKGVLGLFKRTQNNLAALKAQFDKAETNVDKIVESLQSHQVILLKDIAMLDKMYELNTSYFKELTMYILAGKQKLKTAQQIELAEFQRKAAETGLPEDFQAVNDYSNMINRFEKKLHDLELTRTISIQMAPQIRMVQNNDALMLEKIQTSIVNTIPLWKSQMVLAISLHHSKQAMEAQRSVNDMTNELLRKNAEALKTSTINIATESERGIADLETLKTTNQNLIETLEEVRQIQIEGSKQRQNASQELAKIENELKQKLLELSSK